MKEELRQMASNGLIKRWTTFTPPFQASDTENGVNRGIEELITFNIYRMNMIKSFQYKVLPFGDP
jgi:hypothetical protein